MPEDIKPAPTNPLAPATDPGAAAANAAIAQKVADQGRTNLDLDHSDGAAMDALMEAKRKEAEEKAAKADEAPPAKKEGDDAPPVEKKTDDSAPPVEKKGDEGTPPPPKKEVTPPADPFSDLALPPKSSPKAAEQFAAVKERAAKALADKDTELSEARKKISELEARPAAEVPAELNDELKQLREFRAKLDVEADPQFKKFDEKITNTSEFIYSLLKKSGAASDDAIAKIKQYGGPHKVIFEKVLDKVEDPIARRQIEMKLAEIESTVFDKEKAIEATKAKVAEYVAERQKQIEEAATGHQSATKKELDDLIGKMDWLKPKQADAKADDATKKSIEERNNFLAEIKKEVDLAAQDDSPKMRAILLAGMTQLTYLQRVHENTLAILAQKDKAIAEKDALIGKLKSAGGRLRESNAPVEPAAPVTKNKTEDGMAGVPTTHALDALRAARIAEIKRNNG